MKTEDKLRQIAEEVRRISQAIRKFRDGPLTDRCIVTLLAATTRLPRGTIQAVMDGLDGLEEYCLKDLDE